MVALYQVDMTLSQLDEDCGWTIFFGRENNRDWQDLEAGTVYDLSGLSGKWSFSHHINGRRSYVQTSCIDPAFQDENCNLSGKQLFYDDVHGWMFTGDELNEPSFCLDDDNNGLNFYTNPVGCREWSGIPESISGPLNPPSDIDYPVFFGGVDSCDDLPKKLCVSGADLWAQRERIYLNGEYELVDGAKTDDNGNQYYKLVSCADGEPCDLREDVQMTDSAGEPSVFIRGAVSRIALSNNIGRNEPYWALRYEFRFSHPVPSSDYQQELYTCNDNDPKASPDLCQNFDGVIITSC